MSAEQQQTLVETLKAFSDPLRADVLRLLTRDSFGVLEIAHILDVSQPALSHHLKVLARAGLVATRRDGNSIYYRRAPAAPAQSPAPVLTSMRDSVFAAIDHLPLDAARRARIDQVHRARAERSRAFFAEHAGDFESQRARICHPDVYLPAVASVLPAHGRRALDVGPGGGEALPLLAQRFERVVGIDDSRAMLARARRHLRERSVRGVTLRHGDFLAMERTRFDVILFGMVLHHAPSPGEFVGHARSLLAAGGRLVIVELVDHDQEWVRDACGDLWLGFAPDELTRMAHAAGLESGAPQYLAQRNGFDIQIHTFEKGAAR
jgi:DNA-binding transcriptional ArsR family regulator/precorrin-6B methylase 2